MAQNFTPLDLDVPLGGGRSKEAEPVLTPREPMHEVVEHEANKDLESFINTRREAVPMTPELDEAGAAPASAQHFTIHKPTAVPIPDDKIAEGLEMPVDSSFRWLAEFALQLLKKLGFDLKVEKGKITRIDRPVN